MQMLLHRQMVMASQLSQLFVDRFGEDQWNRTNNAAAKRSAGVYGPLVPLPPGIEVSDLDIENAYALHCLLGAF